MRLMQFGLVALVFWLHVPGAFARDWIVAPDGGGDAPTIQAAIDSAQAGDVVSLLPGRYSWLTQGGRQPSSGATMVILKPDVRLRGRDGATRTILDAESRGRVLLLPAGAASTVEGLTITGGFAENCINLRCRTGGGVLIFNSHSVVRDCIIVGNYAQAGGGGIAISISDALIERNRILLNSTEPGGNGGGGIGLLNPPLHPTIRQNTIVGNIGDGIAAGDGNGLFELNILAFNRKFPGRHFGGKGVSCAFGQPTLRCNDLWSNEGSDVLCGIDAGGNFVLEPEFCGADPYAYPNYSLQSDSPCLPEVNSCHALIGAMGAGCGVVDAIPSTWSAMKNVYR